MVGSQDNKQLGMVTVKTEKRITIPGDELRLLQPQHNAVKVTCTFSKEVTPLLQASCKKTLSDQDYLTLSTLPYVPVPEKWEPDQDIIQHPTGKKENTLQRAIRWTPVRKQKCG